MNRGSLLDCHRRFRPIQTAKRLSETAEAEEVATTIPRSANFERSWIQAPSRLGHGCQSRHFDRNRGWRLPVRARRTGRQRDPGRCRRRDGNCRTGRKCFDMALGRVSGASCRVCQRKPNESSSCEGRRCRHTLQPTGGTGSPQARCTQRVALITFLAMTLEELRPDLLREFETCFEAIAQALAKAAEQRSVDPAESVAELLGLKEQGDGKPSQTGSGANMRERRSKARGGVKTMRRVPHSKLLGQFGS